MRLKLFLIAGFKPNYAVLIKSIAKYMPTIFTLKIVQLSNEKNYKQLILNVIFFKEYLDVKTEVF